MTDSDVYQQRVRTDAEIRDVGRATISTDAARTNDACQRMGLDHLSLHPSVRLVPIILLPPPGGIAIVRVCLFLCLFVRS